jgi:predicted nuclease of predicted toxin-antitoxin system
MKLIADENLHRNIITTLQNEGYDVFCIQDNNHGISDEEIVEIYGMPNSVIVTEDKDFGDLTFLKKINTNAIILLRYSKLLNEVGLIIPILLNFLKENKLEYLKGKFTVLTPFKKRIRLISQNIN